MSQIRVKFANTMPLTRFSLTGHVFAGICFKFCRNITMGEVSPPYCFGSLGVNIESAMSQIRVKFANIIPLACVPFKFCRNITVGEFSPPYCFGSLRVKIESEMSQNRVI